MRKNKNTWIILAAAIFLAAALYYFFYRNNAISGFQSQQLCPYSALTDIIKFQSGKYANEIKSLPCSLTVDDFKVANSKETPLYITYMFLLSESYIVKKFLNMDRVNGDYILVEGINPKNTNSGQLSFSEEIDKYISAILEGVKAVKSKLTSSDADLLSTVNGILDKFGPTSEIIKTYGSIQEYIRKSPDLQIDYKQTPEKVVMRILSYFKSFNKAAVCNNNKATDVTLNYDNILDFTYVLKLLYGIVKGSSPYPNLKFNELEKLPAYPAIKQYYLNPQNRFSGYFRSAYPTDDEYMKDIISKGLINNVVAVNITSEGKINKVGSAEDILYNRVKMFSATCDSLSGDTTCYTTEFKNMCDKLKYIRDYTGSIEDIDVVGYSLPTAAGSPTTTAAGNPTTTAAGSPTTTAAGSTSTTAGETTTTAAGNPTTTAAGNPTTTAAGGTTTTAAGATSTTAAGATSTTAAGGTTTTTPMIFDLASQLDYQKFLDDLSVLFTGRTGDPSEVVNTLLNLNQEQRNSICSTYCNGLYAECTDICRLAKCENCTGGVDNTLTGAGKPSTDTGYSNYNASYNLLDNISDNQLGLGGGNGQGGTSSHVGPMLYQKEGDGISNIFAPYVLVQPAASGSGAGYSSFMLNNPNDPLYKAYLSQLITDYNNAQ